MFKYLLLFTMLVIFFFSMMQYIISIWLMLSMGPRTAISCYYYKVAIALESHFACFSSCTVFLYHLKWHWYLVIADVLSNFTFQYLDTDTCGYCWCAYNFTFQCLSCLLLTCFDTGSETKSYILQFIWKCRILHLLLEQLTFWLWLLSPLCVMYLGCHVYFINCCFFNCLCN